MKRVYQYLLVCGLLSCLLCGSVLADGSTTSGNGVGRDEVTDPARTEFQWGGGQSDGNGAGRGYVTFGSIMSTIFGGVWAIMGNEMPLIGLTFQQFFLGMLAINVGIWILHKMGIGSGGGVGSRTSSTNRARVSDRRKDDEI